MPTNSSLKTLRPTDLPAPPQAALEIIRASSMQNVSQRDLARIVTNDPVLTAEILRIVNSPLYGLANKVSGISHALSVLGMKALRNLVLCISVRDVLSKQQLVGFDISAFWEDALRRAVAARLLAKLARVDQDEAFTAGLLQDFGLLILFHSQPDKTHTWVELRGLNPDQRMLRETQLFGTSHDQVIKILATSWRLPEDLTNMLGFHHHAEQIKTSASTFRFCQILLGADWMVSVYTAGEQKSRLNQLYQEVGKLVALSTVQVDEVLSQMPAQVEQAALALGLRVTHQLGLDEIMKMANATLAEDNLSYQELTWRLNNAIKERDLYADELKREMDVAQEIQRKLLPVNDQSLPVFGVNLPAKTLSGDFYDYFRIADGSIYFNLADVSGKGITAALLMTKACSLFRCLGKDGKSIQDILTLINREIYETATRGMFVTMVAGCYSAERGEVLIVNAGHLPVLILDAKGAIRELAAQGLPLGIVADASYDTTCISIAGCALYAFTDGITEHIQADGNRLELAGLKSVLSVYKDVPVHERLQCIITRIFGANALARDDITMLLLDTRYGH